MNLRTYDTLADFAAVQAKDGDLTLVDAPGLPGKKAWRIRLNPQSNPLANPEQRVHCLTDEFIQPGMTIAQGWAEFLPSDRPAGAGWDSFPELHQSWHGPNLSYGGPAPGWGNKTGDRRAIIVRGGPVKPDAQGGGSFIQSQWGDPGDGHGYKGQFLNGIPSVMPKGRWTTTMVVSTLDKVNGRLNAEIDGVLAVDAVGIPVGYDFSMMAFPVNGYRQGSNGANNNEAISYQGAACIGDEADVRAHLAAFIATAPAPSTADLLTAASAAFASTTITHPDWQHRVDTGWYAARGIDPATATGWGKGFALLDRAKS